MKFNINKSNALNAGSKNQLHKNRMRETWLDCNSHKKDQEGFVCLKFNTRQLNDAVAGEGKEAQNNVLMLVLN